MKNYYKLGIPFFIACCIFALSFQDADTSRAFTRNIAEAIASFAPFLPISSISHFNHLLREVGHILEYFLLSLGMIWALYKIGNTYSRRLLFTVIGVVLISFIDESIQFLFSPGRAFQFVDLAKDWLGMLGAILIYYLYRVKKFTK